MKGLSLVVQWLTLRFSNAGGGCSVYHQSGNEDPTNHSARPKSCLKSREEKENINKGDGAQEIQARNHFRTLFEKS